MRRSLIWLAATLGTLACSEHAEPTGTNAATIEVQDNHFTPQQFAVTAGGTVTWAWTGGNSHNVTFDDGPASVTQAAGRFERQFATAGTYRYHCTIHGPSMSGTVTVR